MDFTPASYKTSSPHVPSAGRLKPSVSPATSYPTPPQTRGHSEFLSVPSTTIRGLGIRNCDLEPFSTAQFPICGPSQSFLQPSPLWPQDTPSSSSFTNAASNLGGYQGIGFYEDLAAISTHESSPFAPTASHAHTPDQFAFFSPQQPQGRIGNPAIQAAPVLDDYGLSEGAAPIARPQQPMVKYGLPSCSAAPSTNRYDLKRSLADVDSVPYHASASTVPPYVGQNVGGTLPELDHSIKRPTVHGRTQRSPLGSSNVNTTQAEPATSAPRPDRPVKRQKKRNTAVAKYKCGTCGKDFTRNSNCKSHMKTHDPARNYPHKCEYGQCTKKFSRKTDLERHVDSVHKKLKNFECDQCGQRFSRRDTLRRHCEDGCRRRQRQSQRTSNPAAPASASTSLGSLQSHRLRHTQHETVMLSQSQPHPSFIAQGFPTNTSDIYQQFTS